MLYQINLTDIKIYHLGIQTDHNANLKTDELDQDVQTPATLKSERSAGTSKTKKLFHKLHKYLKS